LGGNLKGSMDRWGEEEKQTRKKQKNEKYRKKNEK
jgi:hypothetical protein